MQSDELHGMLDRTHGTRYFVPGGKMLYSHFCTSTSRPGSPATGRVPSTLYTNEGKAVKPVFAFTSFHITTVCCGLLLQFWQPSSCAFLFEYLFVLVAGGIERSFR